MNAPRHRRRPPRAVALLFTCEHATRWIPASYAARLELPVEDSQGHRGFDIGAAQLARRFSRVFGAAVVLGRIGRLLVDLNRSPSNPRIWSTYSKHLPAEDKAEILSRYYSPHHQAIRDFIDDRVAQGQRVLHVAVHSFTPRLGSVERTMDVGLLYDPARPWERDVVAAWRSALRGTAPKLVVRRNAPYRGTSDGLTRQLRRRHDDGTYAGLELEVNQAWIRGGRFASPLARAVLDSFARVAEAAGHRSPS